MKNDDLSSDSIKLKQITNEMIFNSPPVSILEYCPTYLKMNFNGNFIIDEFIVWSFIKELNLIENSDMKEIKKLVKRCAGVFLISVASSVFVNRNLTKLKLSKKRFIDYNLILKFFTRSSIFGLFFYAGYKYLIDDFIKMHFYMNRKYAPRYKKMLETFEPLVMNPGYYSDSSLSKDEADSKKKLYETSKMQIMNIVMQSKEIDKEMNLRGNKTI